MLYISTLFFFISFLLSFLISEKKYLFSGKKTLDDLYISLKDNKTKTELNQKHKEYILKDKKSMLELISLFKSGKLNKDENNLIEELFRELKEKKTDEKIHIKKLEKYEDIIKKEFNIETLFEDSEDDTPEYLELKNY